MAPATLVEQHDPSIRSSILQQQRQLIAAAAAGVHCQPSISNYPLNPTEHICNAEEAVYQTIKGLNVDL